MGVRLPDVTEVSKSGVTEVSKSGTTGASTCFLRHWGAMVHGTWRFKQFKLTRFVYFASTGIEDGVILAPRAAVEDLADA